MSNIQRLSLMPTKLRYRFLVAVCLMSVLPILMGAYLVSFFLRYPFETSELNLMAITLISGLSIFIAFLGYLVSRQLIKPIANIAIAAEKIAKGRVYDGTMEVKGIDELEDLSRSLKVISKNAQELLDKVERLSLRDKLTGLYNVSYIRERLSEEIQRAIHYQRPCSFAYLLVDQVDLYAVKYGQPALEQMLKSIASILSSFMGEFDRAARVYKNEFAIVFPDKNKKRAIEILYRLRAEVDKLIARETPEGDEARLWVYVGISENPIDGVLADQLYAQAQARMRAARANRSQAVEAFA